MTINLSLELKEALLLGVLFLMMLCAIATINRVLYMYVTLMPRNVLTVYGILHYFTIHFLIHFGCFSLSGIKAYELLYKAGQ